MERRDELISLTRQLLTERVRKQQIVDTSEVIEMVRLKFPDADPHQLKKLVVDEAISWGSTVRWD